MVGFDLYGLNPKGDRKQAKLKVISFGKMVNNRIKNTATDDLEGVIEKVREILKLAQSEPGVYFRANNWTWHPLWDYCEWIAPDLIPEDNEGHSNSGWELDETKSKELAKRLREKIKSGEVAMYKQWFDEKGRLDTEKKYPTFKKSIEKKSDWFIMSSPDYQFNVDEVSRFVEFLENCGGFKIK